MILILLGRSPRTLESSVTPFWRSTPARAVAAAAAAFFLRRNYEVVKCRTCPEEGRCFHATKGDTTDHTVSYDRSVHMIWDSNKMK